MAASSDTTTAHVATPPGGNLVAFLRRELAPFPGRGIATLRIVIACVGVVVVCMTLRVPEAHLAAWFVFKVALEDAGETLLTGIVALAAITVALVFALVLLIVALDQPALRVFLLGTLAALGLFLRRTLALGLVGLVIGLLSVVVLTLPDFVPRPELMVRLTLWLWPVFALGVAGAVAANLWIAPNDPELRLRAELADRIGSAASAVTRRLSGAEPDRAADRYAEAGTARLAALLRSAELLHPSLRVGHERHAALSALVDRIVTAAAALEVLTAEPGTGERVRLEAVAAACGRIRQALEDDEVPAPGRSGAVFVPTWGQDSAVLPLVVELELAVTQTEGILAGAEVAVDVPPDAARGLFVADAFTNPAYVRYALKGALAVLVCYVAQSAVAWPGIRTCLVTCMIVGLASDGATIQKGSLRIAGAVVGGALGFLAILWVVPHMESIASLVLLVAAGSAVAAWVYVGSARISYAGVQIAFAFYVCVIQGFEPAWHLATIRDRLIGILFGNVVITLVFLFVWPEPARRAIAASLGSALRAMAELARAASRHGEPEAVATAMDRARGSVDAHLAAARQSAEEERFAWIDAGPERSAEHGRLEALATQARAVFLTLLVLAVQRRHGAVAETSEALREGVRRFDGALAENLEAAADRLELRPPRDAPDLGEALEVMSVAFRNEVLRASDGELIRQLGVREALTRELVPRVRALASTQGVG